MNVLGAVLAGGRSTRFGTDKASARLAGTSLLERAVATLGAAFGEVVVVSADRAHELAGARRIPDLRPGLGPLAGIEAALDHGRRRGFDGVFVLACDLPLVEADEVRSLVDRLGDAPAVASERDGSPGFEPLCAFYRTSSLIEATRLLDAGMGGAHRLLEAVGGVVLGTARGTSLNVNTRADFTAAEDALRDIPK